MMSKTKLELTWIGKNERKKLEPRILLEDPSKSYHASQKVTENDIFDNKLIFGDNLLALKALEQEYAGKVKCVYIDPPFNTGSAFEHYDDGLEHSIWLGLMRDRLEIIRNLLSDDGVIFVHLDDCEMAYLKVLMDEIFGRANQLNTISMTTNDPSGFKATGATVFSTVNFFACIRKRSHPETA
ncbi:site-specific DNA-methyltransferase [Escherichia coli]|nr:site-specific DNA-methyltransferase [Escherichia coli]